ncbi:STE20-like serine/threonine-protein kinase [Triplophysa rosa]|uniref:Mitogen-activated protein kinase kinase kinase 14 n=1 Tax=Triplophysa rosa TaxID=992332 RepID=A0A9W7T8R7_TRIRA|nr:STE20-like serine/threonine-protein kinase [Triplophysa rosa]KAI7792296.1 putative mitogen-activated protein kinase kinase kinase 14 [Triplophysa rosa]
MAIPTMFHSEVSMLNETASTAGGECEEQPVIQTRDLEELQTEDAGISHAQPRGGECRTCVRSSVEDGSIQSYTNNRSLSDTSCTSSERETKATARSFRKHHRKHRTDVRKPRRTWREDDDGRKGLKDAGSRRRNASRNNSSSRCFKRSPFSSTTERPSQPQTPDRLWDCPHEFIAIKSCLWLHRLEVDFPSTVESHSTFSDHLETNSAYIYAESIKGLDSYSTFVADSDIHNPNARVDISNGQDLISVWNGLSQDLEYLYISSEDKSSSDASACSTQATAGSEFSAHFETFIDMDCESSAVTDNGCSIAEAVWGSASSPSSDSSCCTTDRDSESSYCTNTSDSESPDVSSVHGFQKIPFESVDEHKGSLDSRDALRPDTVENVCRDAEDEIISQPDLRELSGVVIQTERCHFSDIFCEMIKEATQEKVGEKININAGFLFHPKQFLQAKSSRYRESLEYSVLRHIQNGSYGDVFSIRDKQTGFTCAAKKIPLCSFRWEEVETWSRLSGPHVLQLYGAVREGPNVMLFMDLKRGSLAQVLRMRGGISEGLALYYHSQVVQALEHLHMRRVVHLDVKVDNVLLSEDGRQCFLCDFGLSETVSEGGHSTKAFRGNVLRGTESHMPPEVARGDRRCAKADVWSSCCMLLHMLTGHQPWTRCFPHPLYLKIVSEPPPLWEIPSDCDPLTCDVIKAGLVKEPRDRPSASELLQKTVQALRTVCGLSDPGRDLTPTFEDWPTSYDISVSSTTATQKPPESSVKTTALSVPENLSAPIIHWVSTWRERAAREDDSDPAARDSEEENEWEEDGGMNELNRDQTSIWTERHWGAEKTKRNVEKDTSVKPDEETDVWDEDVATVKIFEQTRDCGDESDAEERKTDVTADHVTEKRVVFGDCCGNDRGRLLEEMESFDGEFRSFGEDEETDEEVESDLESLRELGNDWTQEEWEPFVKLQTLYRSKHSHPQSDGTYTDSDEESVTLMQNEEKDARLPDSREQQTVTFIGRSDSEQDLSEEDSDDLSSGVFSSCSTTDNQSFNVDWSVSTNQTSSCYFEGLGVDIWVEDVSGESLKIRERPQVKIGHVAVGISEQISMRVFSLATLDGRLVSPDTEVCESGMWLQCVPAPDGSPSWDWRVKDGKLELQEYDEHSDTCSTLPR